MKIPAPDDWDEEQDGYAILFACIPDSPKWRTVYRGQFQQLTWYKMYEKDGPPFNPAIEIAEIVYKGLCMANCQDIVTQLTRIADALEAIALITPTPTDNQEIKEIMDSINEILGGDSVVEPETVP